MDLNYIKSLDSSNLSEEQMIAMKAHLREGRKHLKYFKESERHFKFPELRLKTFDTVQFEKTVPELERIFAELNIVVK